MRLLIATIALLLPALAAACGSSGGDEAPNFSATASPASLPAHTASPAPTPVPSPSDDAPLYLALGDSLSYGNGASDRSLTSFVALVAQALGPGYGLLNLGVPGHTSDDLLNGGPLDNAIAEIQRRADDGSPGNEVAVITLEIGGNDLLNLYFNLVIPGTCPSVTESLQRPQCVQALQDALNNYQPHLQRTLQRLQEAAPGVPLFLMTVYNPFSGGANVIDELGELSLEGNPDSPFPEGLNDIIRREAAAAGVPLVEWHPLFAGKQSQYIAGDFIHPNDAGYRAMADALTAAMAQAGLPLR
ncbi:MAG: GDSL-type esterase/lipase family protein [Dehalococcoidia bacterium]|nr:GDSL-type esterase/lipase family protein [Dehalococcoidia bacterium]